jgi:hypothetical protein
MKSIGSVAAGHTDLDGSCDTFWDDMTGDFCFFHSSANPTSIADFWLAPCDLTGFTFVSPGDGQGQPVIDNWVSAFNADPRLSVRLFTGPNCTNPVGEVQPGATISFIPGIRGFTFFLSTFP